MYQTETLIHVHNPARQVDNKYLGAFQTCRSLLVELKALKSNEVQLHRKLALEAIVYPDAGEQMMTFGAVCARETGFVPGCQSAVSGCRLLCAVFPDSGKSALLAASGRSYTEQLLRCSLRKHESV